VGREACLCATVGYEACEASAVVCGFGCAD
jgi:hypothetical protein